MRYQWHLLNALLFQLTVAPSVFRADLRFLNMQRRGSAHDKECFTKTCMEWGVVILSSLGLGLFDWRRFLLYVYIPHITAQWGIVTMNMLQHDGCDVPSETDTSPTVVNFNTSRNFTGGLLNFLTFNNGFHTVHHIHPSMHWSLLPAAHTRIAHRIHPALNEASMPRYIFAAFVYPGVRVDYLGQRIATSSHKSDANEDQTADHGHNPPPHTMDYKDYVALVCRYIFSSNI